MKQKNVKEVIGNKNAQLEGSKLLIIDFPEREIKKKIPGPEEEHVSSD